MTVSEIHFNNRSRIHSLTRDGGRGAHPCGGGVYCVKADFLRLTLRNAALESTEMSWERPSASHPQAGAVWVLWSMQTDIGCFTGDSIGSLFIYLPFTMTSWVSCHEAPVGQWFLLLHLRGTTEQMIDTIFAALFERCHSTLSLKLCVWRRLCLTFLTIKKQKKTIGQQLSVFESYNSCLRASPKTHLDEKRCLFVFLWHCSIDGGHI